jgi:hypothetical protein
MTRQLRIFWWGILIYAISFFLVAAQFAGDKGPTPWYGFLTAYFTFLFPWQEHLRAGAQGFFGDFVNWTSLTVAGWINPAFIVAAFLDLSGQYKRTFAILRVFILVMIPFCWVFFARAFMYPREGHFAWIGGMVMALFSKEIEQRRARRDVFSL